jgi:hypothetical protein
MDWMMAARLHPPSLGSIIFGVVHQPKGLVDGLCGGAAWHLPRRQWCVSTETHVVGRAQGGSVVWCRGSIDGRLGKDYVDLCHEGGPTIDCNDGF